MLGTVRGGRGRGAVARQVVLIVLLVACGLVVSRFLESSLDDQTHYVVWDRSAGGVAYATDDGNATSALVPSEGEIQPGATLPADRREAVSPPASEEAGGHDPSLVGGTGSVGFLGLLIIVVVAVVLFHLLQNQNQDRNRE